MRCEKTKKLLSIVLLILTIAVLAYSEDSVEEISESDVEQSVKVESSVKESSVNESTSQSVETAASIKENLAPKPRDYSFNIFPGSLFISSMEQMNEDYQSATRMFNRTIESLCKEKKILDMDLSMIINFSYLQFLYPVTHEEGHRSILTNQGIGAISQPFFNTNGAAYVKGVTDSTLVNLRGSNLPSFIRMYTAGIESDYMMTRRDEKMVAFGQDKSSIIYPDFFMRILSVSSYEQLGAIFLDAEEGGSFSKWIASFYEMTEEDNELERDICGIDTLGAVHAMFYPNDNFKRYVSWSDLNKEEKDFMFYRITFRGYLNYLNPFLFYIPTFNITDNISLTGSMGYALAPFGDFIDENIYFSYNQFHFAFYMREYENYNTWFPAFGISLCDYKPFDFLSFTFDGHFWMEPDNLNFYSTSGSAGCALKLKTSLFLPLRTSAEKAVSVDLSLLYKTFGYLPEVESHEQLFRVACGTTVRY